MRKTTTHNKSSNRMSYFTSYALCIAVALLWIARKRLDFDVSTLMVLTGLALILLIVGLRNKKREKENEQTAKALEETRKEMSGDILDEKNYLD